MEKIQFEPNIAQLLALRFPEGKLDRSGRYGDQMFYTLLDGRCWYAPIIAADRIAQLQIQPREPFYVCKRVDGRKTQWDVWRPQPGEIPGAAQVPQAPFVQAAGTGAVTPAPATAAFQPPHSNGHGNNGNNGHANGQGPNGNGNRPYNAAGIPTPPQKMPTDIAVLRAVQIVKEVMKTTGEQWSDAARQDLVSTILITWQREGWIGMPTGGPLNAA